VKWRRILAAVLPYRHDRIRSIDAFRAELVGELFENDDALEARTNARYSNLRVLELWRTQE
jgi:hypothetical protein